MKHIRITLAIICSVLFWGCKKTPGTKPNGLITMQKGEIRCKWCKKIQPVENYRRINQTLASCPSCQKTIHIMESLYGRKKKTTR